MSEKGLLLCATGKRGGFILLFFFEKLLAILINHCYYVRVKGVMQ
jgi:hypothetical protein